MSSAGRPVVTVAALAERDGRFLLVEERVRGRLLLNQPAGHLEADESPQQGVARETLEEAAWRFAPTALVGIYLWRHPQGGKSYLRLAFAGRLDGEEPDRQLDRGVVRSLWMSREEIAAEHARLRSPLVLRCVDDWRAGRRFPLELLATLYGST